jgi:hypothetical protein
LNQARFLKTLPVPVVEADGAAALVAGGFLAVPDVTAFLTVLIIVRLAAVGCGAGGFGCAPGGAVMGRFLTTVEVLPSLDSLMPLTLRAIRVAGLDGGFAAAVTVAPLFLPSEVVPVVVAALVAGPLGAAEVIVLRAVAVVGRVVDRVPSTILLSMFVATTALPGVTTGRAMPDLPGVATLRGAIRELEVVGDNTCAGLRAISVPGLARTFFWGVCISFSLSPPEISWL